eukprot:gene27135-2365_t
MSYVVTPIDINGIMHIDPPDFKYKPGDCGAPPQPNVDTITNTNVRKSGRIREVVGKPDFNEIDSADDMVVVISSTVREKARLRQQQCRA